VFSVQDEIARAVAVLVAAHVDKAELNRALIKPPASLQAYDCYLRGVSSVDAFYAASFYAANRDIHHLRDARRWFEQAIAIDPRHARAYAALAASYSPSYVYRFKDDEDFCNPATLERMRTLALRAIELDPRLPDAHNNFGGLLTFQGQHDASIAAYVPSRSIPISSLGVLPPPWSTPDSTNGPSRWRAPACALTRSILRPRRDGLVWPTSCSSAIP
jgi:adenylate cyclase